VGVGVGVGVSVGVGALSEGRLAAESPETSVGAEKATGALDAVVGTSVLGPEKPRTPAVAAPRTTISISAERKTAGRLTSLGCDVPRGAVGDGRRQL
jgi:hypothetical protein